ncbi:TetR/AcrR family transcriptional regulator [Nocardia puris]|uniref:TetR family transcriptional regulator n=1 Tax=Nocardia puris TaxID=208602 RepID=A0A366DWM2_9NOCA|nr:TetR/AcrR family transcriptional regulator [Nocardia puris]RBO94511.1 TetR family transcriptional regulator [Nocardia puris]
MATKRQILDAAARLFGERGIAQTSTNRIAAEAGVSIGTLYRYFADRSALVDELLDRLLDTLEQRLTARMFGLEQKSVREVITIILEVMTEQVAAEAPLVRALADGVPFYSSGMPEFELRVRLMVKLLIMQLLGPGDSHEYEVMTSVVVNTCIAAVLRAALADDGYDRAEIIAMTARMITPMAEEEIAARQSRQQSAPDRPR